MLNVNLFRPCLLTIALVLALGGTEAAAAPITGVTATTTIPGCCGAPLSLIVDGSGLSSFDPSASHNGLGGTGWIGLSRTGTIDFDLHGTYWLGGIAVWNSGFGVKEYSLSVSTDGLNFTPLGGFPVGLADVPTGSTTFAEVTSFTAVQATHVRMTLLDGHSRFDNTSLKEVMFLSADTPEPATLPVLGLAVMALGALRLCRR